MSARTQRNKRIVLAFARAVGSPDPVGPYRYVSRTYRLSGGILTGELDLLEAVQWRQAVLRAFPDLQVQVDPDDLVAEDSRVAVHVRWTGTHRGTYRGIPPTGRKVDVRLFAMFELRNGLIEREVHLTDSLQLVEQIRGSDAGTLPRGAPLQGDRVPVPGDPSQRFYVPTEELPGPWWGDARSPRGSEEDEGAGPTSGSSPSPR